MSVRVERKGAVTTVILERPEVRNAVDGPTAEALVHAFEAFEKDPEAKVAVLGVFCRRWGVP
jgi:enoyl-CoA hydratase